MPARDNVSKVGTLFPATPLPAVVASFTGPTIDLQASGDYNAATIYLLAGAWTDGTHTFTIQEAPDNGSGAPGAWTTVDAVNTNDLTKTHVANPNGGLPISYVAPGAGVSGLAPISSAATALNQRVGYLGFNRFLRVNGVVAGATSGAKYAIVVVAGEPRVLPAQV